MAIVNVNSIAGINSITAQSNSVTFYKPNGQLADVIGNFPASSPVGIASTSYATRSEIVGISTTAATVNGNTTITLIDSLKAANILNGYGVAGSGVVPGTIVSSGGGTVNLVLSQPVEITDSTNRLTFYTNSKVVAPGGIGGMLCRAWVNFNGSLVGSVTGTRDIRASYNVSSVTYVSQGDYVVNFTESMPDSNYCAVGSGGLNNNTNVAEVTVPASPAPTADGVSVHTEWGGSPSITNLTTISIAVFR